MDRLIRFSDYDVLAYVTSGLLALALADILGATHFVIGANWSVSEGILTVLSSYALGHLLATPSAWLLDEKLVWGLLNRPSQTLMGNRPDHGFRGFIAKTILRNYYTPLNSSLQVRLVRIIKTRNLQDAEGLFWLAFPEVKSDPMAYGRMSAFLNLYGFSRNVAFVLGLGGVALIATSLLGFLPIPNDNRVWFGLAAIVGSFGMLHRYLKFYRLYGVEVFTTFDAMERRRHED